MLCNLTCRVQVRYTSLALLHVLNGLAQMLRMRCAASIVQQQKRHATYVCFSLQACLGTTSQCGASIERGQFDLQACVTLPWRFMWRPCSQLPTLDSSLKMQQMPTSRYLGQELLNGDPSALRMGLHGLCSIADSTTCGTAGLQVPVST